LAAGLSGVGSSSLPLAGASVAVAADENAYGSIREVVRVPVDNEGREIQAS